MDTTSSQPPNLFTITNRQTHDAALHQAQGTKPACTDGTRTLIYICSSAIPACKTATPKVIDLARTHPDVAVYLMELTAEVSPMIKFGPQNTPIFILIWGRWCETVVGLDWRRVETLVRAKFEGGE